MAYQVIARKWRPQNFSEVIGQEHVVRTLKNEIVLGRTAHAYLFVGPRGIGKTTLARIFSKALNCGSQKDGEPCGKCQSCTSISDGSSLDVIEIDGASNNSVDNIRALREEVHYAPPGGRYKIYIIDEVHMLSASAWNALLKTVEEPPSHIKFIFATTEAHKVLATIVSRCQRFDLQRIPMKLIARSLRKIADTEKIRIDDGAIAAIARAADGGMRDGQSLLDQTISFFSGLDSEITEKDVLEIFGLASAKDMEKLVEAIVLNNPAAVISGIHSLSSAGRNLERIFEDILSFIRGVEICLLVSNPGEILEDSDENISVYSRLAKDCEPRRIQVLLETLSSSGRGFHDALNKQIYMESLLLKAMRTAHSARIEDLIRRIQQIRETEGLDDLKKNDFEELKSVKVQIPAPPPADPPNFDSLENAEIEIVPEMIPEPQPGPAAVQPEHPDSEAHRIWHKLIEHMDKLNKPLLKAYMQEGTPVEITGDQLTVVYDQDFEMFHVSKLKEESRILNQGLHSITGNRNLSISFMVKKGAAAPVEPEKQVYIDRATRDRVEANKFVNDVIEVFEGKIKEIRG